MSAHEGQTPHWKSIANRGVLWPFVLAGLMLVSLLAARGRVWAAPGQDPQRQTVPTPTEVPEAETKVPAEPGPVAPALPTSTSTPLPLPTATSSPTTSVPAASPSVQLTLLPAPAGQTPTVAEMCQPLEKTISPLRGGELDLLVPCRILVQVPAGAVIEDTLLRLAPRLLTDAPPSETWLQMRSVAFTLDALSAGGHPRSGFVFARPYTVTIRYNQTDVEIGEGGADNLTVAYYDAAAQKWVSLDSQVDPKERLVSAEFDQPGWLALMLALGQAYLEPSRRVEGMNVTEGRPTRQPASTPSPSASGTALTTMAPTFVASPSNQLEEANNRMCLLGIAGAPFLLSLVTGLYAASRRWRKD